jgi:hypothetical protein
MLYKKTFTPFNALTLSTNRILGTPLPAIYCYALSSDVWNDGHVAKSVSALLDNYDGGHDAASAGTYGLYTV